VSFKPTKEENIIRYHIIILENIRYAFDLIKLKRLHKENEKHVKDIYINVGEKENERCIRLVQKSCIYSKIKLKAK